MFSGRNPVTLMNLRLRAQYFLGGTAFRCPALWLCLSTFAGAAAVTDNHRIRATAALLPESAERSRARVPRQYRRRTGDFR